MKVDMLKNMSTFLYNDIGGGYMGRPKGGKNRKWTAEQKYQLIQEYLASGIGVNSFADSYEISRRLFFSWLNKYYEKGFEGLKRKQGSGNKFAALHTSKSLNETERLQLIIAKQEIEIERLKKGYIVKGVGANKVFVTINNANLK